MINKDKTNEYLKAIEIGFNYYGLNRFFEIHKDVCENPNNPWGYALECLNDLDVMELETLCSTHINKRSTIQI